MAKRNKEITDYDRGYLAGYSARQLEEINRLCNTCAEFIPRLAECSMGFLSFLEGEDLDYFNGSNFGCIFWNKKIKKVRRKKS